MTTKTLLIEDDPQFVKIVEAALKGLPTELIHCATGKAGLQRVAERDIDLCIVDGVLPDKQGVRVIEDIKAMRAITEPRIVFLSAFFKDVRTYRKLTALGVDLVLSKPILAADLKQKLIVFMPKAKAKPATRDTVDIVGFGAAFARMQQDYVEKMRLSRAPQFEQLIARAERGDDIHAIEEIRLFCHKLRGTAGSYGLDDISEAAARLESGVAYRQLSRLLPEMRQFLALLRNASLGANKPNVERSTDINLTILFRSLLIVSDSPLLYSRVSSDLAEDHLDVRQATTLEEAMLAIVSVQPDLLIVDTTFIDGQNRPVIQVLMNLETEIPVLAFGPPISALPEGITNVDMTIAGEELRAALHRPELRPFPDTTAYLCDDHDNVAEQVEQLLPPLGVSVERCTSASDLLAKVGAGAPSGAAPGALPDEVELPDVIIMDIDFAKRSGIHLARQIRSEAEEPPRIIFLSEQTTLAERSQSYQAGAAGYVLKPLANEQIASAVTRVLRQRRNARFAQHLLPIKRALGRQTDRQTGRQTDRQTDRPPSRPPGRPPGRPSQRSVSRTKTISIDRPNSLFPGRNQR